MKGVAAVSLALVSGLLLAFGCQQGEAPGYEEGSGGSSKHERHTPRDVTQASLNTRTYYIAAEEADWDYAPSCKNQITGEPFGEEEDVFVRQGEHRIGKTYRKALYREYTDKRFTELEPRPPDQEYLGTLGPILRAEVDVRPLLCQGIGCLENRGHFTQLARGEAFSERSRKLSPDYSRR